jgi:large subunit ribosomal protein L14
MLQKETKLRPVDNAGVRSVKCIHVVGKKQKYGSIGDLLLVLIKKFKFKKKLIRKKIYYGLIISLKYPTTRKDGIILKSDYNTIVLLSTDNCKFLGTRIYGPVYKEIRDITDKTKKRIQKYPKVVAYAKSIL